MLARLRGVGDQATTALQKARLLATVRHQATHDALTGLPNRTLFLDRLEQALPEAAEGAHLGVLFCDLDRFKQVNDTLGHAAGDELLRQVSARLRAAVRPADTVGRLSGDEFAIILPGLVEPADARRLADRVTDCFAEPFRLDGTEVTRRHQRRRRGARSGVRPDRRAAPARGGRGHVPPQGAAAGAPSGPGCASSVPQARLQGGLLVGAEPVRLQPAHRPAEPLVEQRQHPVHGLRARRVAGDVPRAPCPRRRSGEAASLATSASITSAVIA